MGKVRLKPNPEFESLERQRPAMVRIHATDGTVLERYVPAVRGTADHPMTRDEVLAKGLDLVNSVYGDARGAQVVDAVMALESLADVRDLRSLLTEA